VGPHDEQFCDGRSGPASWHVAAGVPRRHVIAAIHVLRSEYHDRIDRLYRRRTGRLVARSIDKLLDVDLAVMLRDPTDADGELATRARGVEADRIAAIQTLSAGLAHEVRNPLNSASLQLELLERRLRRGAADPRLIEPVEQVSHEIER